MSLSSTSNTEPETCGHELPDPPYRWTNQIVDPAKSAQVTSDRLMCRACFEKLMAAPWLHGSLMGEEGNE